MCSWEYKSIESERCHSVNKWSKGLHFIWLLRTDSEILQKSWSTLNMWNQIIVKQLQQQSCYIYHWHPSNSYVQYLNACFLFKCLQGSRTSENMFISIQPRAKMGWRVQLTSGMGQRSPVRYKKKSLIWHNLFLYKHTYCSNIWGL